MIFLAFHSITNNWTFETRFKMWPSLSAFCVTETKHRKRFPLTVLCTTLVSDVSIPIALPTAAGASAATLSVSLLTSPAGGRTQCIRLYEGLHSEEKATRDVTEPPLTWLSLLLLNLWRELSRTGDSQRRLCLLYDLSEPLAWMDRRDSDYMMADCNFFFFKDSSSSRQLKRCTRCTVYNTERLGLYTHPQWPQ